MPKKPTRDGFAQKKIGSAIPAGFSSNPLRVACTLAFEQNLRSIDFSLIENVPAGQTHSDVIVQDAQTGKQHLAITKDTIMTITLADNIDWQWVKDQTGITTKADNKTVYGVDGGFDDPVGRSVALYCKARGGNIAKTDGFSFSVELRQSNGSYLPITIDPDIRNPPPGSGFTPAVATPGGTVSVPLSGNI
jgi:hypothetical protein